MPFPWILAAGIAVIAYGVGRYVGAREGQGSPPPSISGQAGTASIQQLEPPAQPRALITHSPVSGLRTSSYYTFTGSSGQFGTSAAEIKKQMSAIGGIEAIRLAVAVGLICGGYRKNNDRTIVHLATSGPESKRYLEDIKTIVGDTFTEIEKRAIISFTRKASSADNREDAIELADKLYKTIRPIVARVE